MASNFSPQWFFQDPALSQKTRDDLQKTMEYIWTLRNQYSNLNQTVQNVNNTIDQKVTAAVTQITANNSGAGKAPVVFGTHAGKSSFSPSLYSGYLYVETDRFQACYYSNGVSWVLVEATATGSFELRYVGLNSTDAGFEWIETSRNNVNSSVPFPFYRWDGNFWNLTSGQWYRNQNAVSTLSATFGANNSNDIGAIVNVIDFAGQLQWQANNNFTWGPNDPGDHGGMFFREVDPTGNWWHLYDGSNNVTYLQANGNIGSVNLPALAGANASGNTFLAGGNVNSNINGPTAPTFTGNAASGTVTGTFSGSGSGSASTTTSNFATGGNNTAAAVTAVTGVSVSVSGSISASFSGNNVTGTISNNGTPQNIIRRPWFRR